jgi:hypothetical protein
LRITLSRRAAGRLAARSNTRQSANNKNAKSRRPPPPPPPELPAEPPPELLDGAAVTVSATALLSAVAAPLLALSRNWSPDIATVVADTVNVPVAVPE